LGGLITGFDLIYTPLGCKLALFIGTCLSPIPVWILAFFSLDQMFAVSRYKHIHVIRKRSFQLTLIACTVLSHVFIYAPIPILVLKPHNLTYKINNMTVEKCDLKSQSMRKFSIIYFLFDTFLPFFILMFATIVILRCLHSSRSRLVAKNKRISVEESTETALQTRRRRRERKFGVNSVVLNVLFIALTSPLSASFIFTINDHQRDTFIKAICLVFFFLNYALHFWIHLFVNSIFRKEFWQLIADYSSSTCCFCCCSCSCYEDSSSVAKKKNCYNVENQEEENEEINRVGL
jgi:hypothetical protein